MIKLLKDFLAYIIIVWFNIITRYKIDKSVKYENKLFDKIYKNM